MRPERRGWYLLLIVPFVAMLVPPIYARETPRLAAWPFFYWWQFAWILVTALLLAVVYQLTTRRAPADQAQHLERGHPHGGEGRR
jgi:hypothetical protein